MNDFTREELIELAHCIDVACYSDTVDRVDIGVKIQYMIDNYCDHKNIVTGAYPRSKPPKKCDACGVLYYE